MGVDQQLARFFLCGRRLRRIPVEQVQEVVRLTAQITPDACAEGGGGYQLSRQIADGD